MPSVRFYTVKSLHRESVLKITFSFSSFVSHASNRFPVSSSFVFQTTIRWPPCCGAPPETTARALRGPRRPNSRGTTPLWPPRASPAKFTTLQHPNRMLLGQNPRHLPPPPPPPLLLVLLRLRRRQQRLAAALATSTSAQWPSGAPMAW